MNKIDKETRASIIRLFNSGHSYRDISRLHGLSLGAIRSVICTHDEIVDKALSAGRRKLGNKKLAVDIAAADREKLSYGKYKAREYEKIYGGIVKKNELDHKDNE